MKLCNIKLYVKLLKGNYLHSSVNSTGNDIRNAKIRKSQNDAVSKQSTPIYTIKSLEHTSENVHVR